MSQTPISELLVIDSRSNKAGLVIKGTDEADQLYGSNEADTINGGLGDDYLVGYGGDDKFIGGLGNDIIDLGSGSDVCLIAKADGQDEIQNSDSVNDIDAIQFTDLASTDIKAVFRDPSIANDNNRGHLILQYGNASQIKLDYYFNGDYYRIDEIRFTDNVVWTWDDLRNLSLVGSAFNDVIRGYTGQVNNITGLDGQDYLVGAELNDTLNGGADNDTLYGDQGDDRLIGGTGNDYFNGGLGNDTYVISANGGQDEIANGVSDLTTDVVVFEALKSTDITAVYRDPGNGNNNRGDLLIEYGNDHQVRLDYFFDDSYYRIDEIQFADSVVWDWDDVKALGLVGTAFDDNFSGYTASNNFLTGLDGKDILSGKELNDTLEGGSGDDKLYGNDGDDVLKGGSGNDYLDAGTGNDTYLFAKGDGQDEIYDVDSSGGIDIIKFTNIASTSINALYRDTSTANNNNGHLVLEYGKADKLTIDYFFANASYRIEQFIFSDGVTWTWEDVKSVGLIGTALADSFYGYEGDNNTLYGLAGDDFLGGRELNDALFGGNGNDELHGYEGNDRLNGGPGNDKLQGGDGSDIYLISKGDGHDDIYDDDASGGIDTVKFTNIASTEITAKYRDPTQQNYNAGNLIFEYANGGQLTLLDYFYSEYYRVDKIEFADGVTWSWQQLKKLGLIGTEFDDSFSGYRDEKNLLKGLGGNDYLDGQNLNDTLYGGAGNDRLRGDDGNDEINGGAGNDDLAGGAGSDVYFIGKNDGVDIIYNGDSDNSIDIVRFTDFTPADITAKYRNPNRANYNDGDLVIQYGTNQITIDNYFYPNYRIDKFIFSDGQEWTWDTLKSLGLIGTKNVDGITGYAASNNIIKGFGGNDVLQGAELNDTIDGGMGDDWLYGQAGNDSIIGGTGNNDIHGGEGDDSLIGGRGNDTFTGGDGSDTYVIGQKFGNDYINNYDNYNDTALDKVVFQGYRSTDVSAITQKGSHLWLTFNDSSELEVGYYFYDDSYKIDQFIFTDTIWTDSDINGNKAPIAANQAVNIDEDHALTFTANQFGFNDSDVGDSLQAIKITQLPKQGRLTLNGVDVAVDQVISVDDINPGELVFTPDSDAYRDHYGDFYFKVSDGQAFSTDAYLFRIDVNPVNDAPYLTQALTNRSVIYDNPLIYKIPKTSFIDVDRGDSLSYSATLSDGSALPSWLNFNSKRLLFTGTPSESDVGDLTINIIVTDKAGAQTSDQFTLSVTNVNSAPTFIQAGDGIVTTALGAVNDWGQALTVQSDGKIVVTGYSETDNGAQMALMRYNSDGSLDTEFNQTGTVLTALAGIDDRAFDLSIDDNGNILVAGFSLTASNYDFAVVRYLANGQLDTRFGEQGIVTTDFGQTNAALFGDRAYSIATQSDGKIIVGGFSSNGKNENFALVRYLQDGSLDTSFSNDGKLSTDLDGGADFGQALWLQDDGKIVVAGYDYQAANTNFQLVRYTTQGTLDTSFGNNGNVSTDFDGKTDWAQDLAIQSDGKLIVAGYNFSAAAADFELARYNSDGSLDISFSDDGKLTTDFNAGLDKAQAIVLQSDGKILVAGSSFNNGQWDFAVARYNSDGSLDADFAGTGYVISDLSSGGNDLAYDLTLQSDGKIVVTGISEGQATVVRYLSNGALDSVFGTINTADNEVDYISHSTAVILNSNIIIYDAELSSQGHYQGASIQLSRHDAAKAQDIFSAQGALSFSNKQALIDGVVIGTINNSQGVLTLEFNANATEQRVNQALASIAYQNTATNPPDTVSIDWLFSDGDTSSAQTTTGTTVVNIIEPSIDTVQLTAANSLQYANEWL
mgnify:CR=1 FL=1